MKNKLEGITNQANNHETQMEDLVGKLSHSDGLDPTNIREMAQETEQRTSKNNGNLSWRRSRFSRSIRTSLSVSYFVSWQSIVFCVINTTK